MRFFETASAALDALRTGGPVVLGVFVTTFCLMTYITIRLAIWAASKPFPWEKRR